MAEITLTGVKKTYQKLQVIHGVDVAIADGEFIVIVGPSGCGKSTLLRMIAGLETVSEGTIAIGGKVVNNVEPKDRNIAMVFQNYALYPHMSAHRHLFLQRYHTARDFYKYIYNAGAVFAENQGKNLWQQMSQLNNL